MQNPKTETQIPAHRRITNYDETPVRDLVEQLDALFEEQKETEALHERLKGEVAQLQKKTRFTDKKQLEILSMKNLQLEMCPGKLSELEDAMTEVKKQLDGIPNGQLGFLKAIESLIASEKKRIIDEIVAIFLPACFDEKEARDLAEKTNRVVRFKAQHYGWSVGYFGGYRVATRGFLILEQFESGSLENAPDGQTISKSIAETNFSALQKNLKSA